jgi:hypothetical protein
MLKSALMVALAGGALVAADFGAFADEYYVVRRPKTHECTVVEHRPTENTLVQVGPLAFKTRGEAEEQRTTLCKNKFEDED